MKAIQFARWRWIETADAHSLNAFDGGGSRWRMHIHQMHLKQKSTAIQRGQDHGKAAGTTAVAVGWY